MVVASCTCFLVGCGNDDNKGTNGNHAGSGGEVGSGGSSTSTGGSAPIDAATGGHSGTAGTGGASGDGGSSFDGGTIDGGDGASSFDGQQIFRHDTYQDESYWTDQLRMHEVIQSSVDPMLALSVGLKVDSDAVPPDVLASADLTSPATTVALIGLGAVVGVEGQVDDNGQLIQVGVTCALCHSTVDDSVMPGIGKRLDGHANRDLNPGAIIALSPTLSADAKGVLNSWGPGRYDPRWNQDGQNDPVLIPSIYGLQGVTLETYTGDGPVSYWNSYVAVTQMGGQGVFSDPRIGVSVSRTPDVVTPKLPALYDYQISLSPPPPPATDAAAVTRGAALFIGKAACSTCHSGSTYTDADVRLHDPAETGMDPTYAQRSATKQYRTTPLRGLADHPPYFHDGSAATLMDVVDHYDSFSMLGLTSQEKSDLVEFLRTL